MQELSRESEEITIRVTLDELRLVLGALNEAVNGAYAIPEDEFEPLVGQPIERADVLSDAIATILER